VGYIEAILRNTFPPAAVEAATEPLKFRVNRFIFSGMLDSLRGPRIAQFVRKQIAANDSDASAKNRIEIENQWNLR